MADQNEEICPKCNEPTVSHEHVDHSETNPDTGKWEENIYNRRCLSCGSVWTVEG